MKLDQTFFNSNSFKSPIKCIEFKKFNIRSIYGGDNESSLPTLNIILENGLNVKLNRDVSWTDFDPYYSCSIKHEETNNEIDIYNTEWSETIESNLIKWNEHEINEFKLEDLIGNKILNIKQYSWTTIVNFEENLFIELKTEMDKFGLSVCKWISKSDKSAKKLFETGLI